MYRISLNSIQKQKQWIISALEAEIVPWEFRYSAQNVGFPTNPVTRRQYGVIAGLLLQIAAERHRFFSKWWATSTQWNSLGISVPNHALRVNILVGNQEFELINGYQVENLSYSVLEPPKYLVTNPKDTQRLQHLVEKSGVSVQVGHGIEKFNVDPSCAWYVPPLPLRSFPDYQDGYYVYIPSNFQSNPVLYYNVLAHELIHWEEPRFGWYPSNDQQELAAEIGAGLLLWNLRFEVFICRRNFMKFRDLWIDGLRRDFRYFVDCAMHAQRASQDLLMMAGYFVESTDFEAVV